MDIKKRDLLTGGALLGAGLAATALPAQAQIPAGVPHATGKTMLDSPNYFGTASKGGGFRKNWARTLPQASSVDPHYRPRRVNKAIELWEDNQIAFYEVYAPSGAPDGYEEGKRLSQTFCDVINTRWRMAVSISPTCATSCRAWSMAAPRRPAIARRWCM
jgi:hypothetical protein